MKRWSVISVLAFGVLLGGCESDQTTDPEETGWVSATVVGAEPVSYQGSGYFTKSGSLPNLGGSIEPIFAVASMGELDSDAAEFFLLRRMAGQPAPGRYAIDDGAIASGGFRVFFHVEHGDSIMQYEIMAGEVEITESTDAVVAGTFDLDAVDGILCRRSGPDHDITDPMPICQAREDAERTDVRIQGAFRSASMQGCPEPFSTYDGGMGHLRPLGFGCFAP